MTESDKTLPPIVLNSSSHRFPLGSLLITPAARTLLIENNADPSQYLQRHATGDWGEICEEDHQQNDFGVSHRNRLMSVYYLVPGQEDSRIWIITEGDRSYTTILLPEDY